jgi:hypothetical protein
VQTDNVMAVLKGMQTGMMMAGKKAEMKVEMKAEN